MPVDEETNEARAIDVAFDLLSNTALFRDIYASVTLGLRHEQADPLYRSAGAFVAADTRTDTVSLDGYLGQLSFQLLHARAEDNLDKIETILKTRTDSTSVSWSLPLQAIVAGSSESPSPLWPQSLSHSYQRTHQFGVNLPPDFDPLTHIPDQLSENHALSLSWVLGPATLSYNYSYGDQDNRQPGRAAADFRTVTNSVNLGFQAGSTLLIDLGIGETAADDKEQALSQSTINYALGLDWRIGDHLGFRGNYSLIEADDSAGFSENRDYTVQTEINWRFELPGGAGRRLPAQLFVRHSLIRSELADLLFGFDSDIKNWTMSAGFNVSIF